MTTGTTFTINTPHCAGKTFVISNIGSKKVSYINVEDVSKIAKRGTGKNQLHNISQVVIAQAESNFNTGFWTIK